MELCFHTSSADFDKLCTVIHIAIIKASTLDFALKLATKCSDKAFSSILHSFCQGQTQSRSCSGPFVGPPSSSFHCILITTSAVKVAHSTTAGRPSCSTRRLAEQPLDLMPLPPGTVNMRPLATGRLGITLHTAGIGHIGLLFGLAIVTCIEITAVTAESVA